MINKEMWIKDQKLNYLCVFNTNELNSSCFFEEIDFKFYFFFLIFHSLIETINKDFNDQSTQRICNAFVLKK